MEFTTLELLLICGFAITAAIAAIQTRAVVQSRKAELQWRIYSVFLEFEEDWYPDDLLRFMQKRWGGGIQIGMLLQAINSLEVNGLIEELGSGEFRLRSETA